MIIKEKSDFITIGHLINELTHQQDEEADYGVSVSYYNYLRSKGYDLFLDTITKSLLAKAGLCNMEVFNFIQTDQIFQGVSCITGQLPINHADAYCTLQLYNNVDLNFLRSQNKHYADYIVRMTRKYNTFVVLDNLVSLESGVGKELVRHIQNTLTCPIALQAGFLKYGDYVTFQNTGDKWVIKKLVEYYESLGFENVNNDMGYYREAVQ